jgi:hypothetical protein
LTIITLNKNQLGETGGIYDVIVDDGGHKRKQQVNSLIGLWPYVRKNGGIYVIEDIFTSFIPAFNDNKQSALDVIFELITILNNPTSAGISKEAIEIRKELASLNCFERACALIKK